MKIALISIHIADNNRAVPLASATLASSLKKQFGDKLEIKLFNSVLKDDPLILENEIISFQPDIAGVSLYVWNTSRMKNLLSRLKQALPHLKTIAGGPEATVKSGEWKAGGKADYVLKGEGEDSLCLLIEALTSAGSLSEQQFEHTYYVEDCSKLPSPYLDGTLAAETLEGILWELSRGCPFRCAFCYESRGKSGIRPFSKERIIRELDEFAKGPPKEIFVLDPTFNYDRKRAAELLDMIIKKGRKHHYSFEIRFEYLTEELADLFSQLNCSLQIGIQSIHSPVLKNINRSIKMDLLEEKCEILNSYGLCFGFDLIFGLPGDSLEGFINSLDTCIWLQPNHIDLFPLSVLPGTELAEKADGLKLKYQKEAPYSVLSGEFFSEQEMDSAGILARYFDVFYNKGKAVPWFYLLLDYLEITASDFLNQLAVHNLPIPEETAEWKQILDFQLESIKLNLDDEENGEVYPVISDMVRYLAIETSLRDGDWNPEETIHEFSRNPEEIIACIESGVTDFSELAFFVPANKTVIDFSE